MGRLAQILKYTSNIVNRLRVNLGGGNQQEVDIVVPAGFDSKPISGDRSFLGEGRATGSYKHLGILSGIGSDSLESGEARIYGRDANGAIVSSVTVFKDGEVLVGNSKGSLLLKTDGSIDANGATITLAGDVVSALGISLNSHIHSYVIGALVTGVPTPTGA